VGRRHGALWHLGDRGRAPHGHPTVGVGGGTPEYHHGALTAKGDDSETQRRGEAPMMWLGAVLVKASRRWGHSPVDGSSVVGVSDGSCRGRRGRGARGGAGTVPLRSQATLVCSVRGESLPPGMARGQFGVEPGARVRAEPRECPREVGVVLGAGDRVVGTWPRVHQVAPAVPTLRRRARASGGRSRSCRKGTEATYVRPHGSNRSRPIGAVAAMPAAVRACTDACQSEASAARRWRSARLGGWP
jgi:hypothetical protein